MAANTRPSQDWRSSPLTLKSLTLGKASISAALVVIASLLAIQGSIGAAAALAVSACACIFWLGQRAQRLAGWALGILLTGYMLLGRGFSYLGFPPVFVGEMVLALCATALLLPALSRRALPRPFGGLLAAVMAVGLVAAVPHFNSFGFDTLRDSVVWMYAAFAVVVALLVSDSGDVELVGRVYARLSYWLPYWFLAAGLAEGAGITRLMLLPGSAVPLLDIKAGGAAVHLAGTAAFTLLRLPQQLLGSRSKVRGPLWWLVWATALLLISNRSGLLAVTVALLVVVIASKVSTWIRPAALLAVAAAVVTISDAQISVGTRQVEPRQLFDRFQSIFVSVDSSRMENTKQWRLDWWGDIVAYTFGGPYFWQGKGYGINLANDDGYQVTGDDSLRSPHNGHMTILARSGVPGLAVWLALQGGFLLAMVGRIRKLRRRGSGPFDAVALWVLALWIAFMVDISFDVVLESPHGGIWFWCVLGFGLALLRVTSAELGDTGRHSPSS